MTIIPRAEIERAAIAWANLGVIVSMSVVFVIGGLLLHSWIEGWPKWITVRQKLLLTAFIGFVSGFVLITSVRGCVRKQMAPSTITAKDMP